MRAKSKNRNMKKMAAIIGVGLMIAIIALSVWIQGSMYIPYYDGEDFFMAEWVFRENYDGIIGNPNFTPSFDHVDSETFKIKYQEKSMELGYDTTIIDVDVESNFKKAFLINDEYLLQYSEGFMILSFDNIDNEGDFKNVLKIVVAIMEPDRTQEELDHCLEQYEKDVFESYTVTRGNGTVDYRFYEDEKFEIHIEDRRMGH